MRSCCIWLVDSVESMMLHGLANPKNLETQVSDHEIHRLARPRPTALLPPRSNGKPEAATAVVELPMKGMGTPETC
jgi:hypothetical protein